MYIYIGPYVLAECNQVETAKSIQGCSNKKCNQYKRIAPFSDNFCSKCGSRIQSCEIPHKESKVNAYELMTEVLEENMVYHEVKGKFYWVSNQTEFLDSLAIEGDTFNSCREIDDALIRYEKSMFLDYHKDQIAILQEAYNGVKITWGLVLEDY